MRLCEWQRARDAPKKKTARKVARGDECAGGVVGNVDAAARDCVEGDG